MATNPEDALAKALSAWPQGPVCLALSGGLDSTVLAHALAASREARARGLRCIHVDHGLHPDSAAWATHCESFAARIEIPFEAIRVTVPRDSRSGLEGAARRARYDALAARLRDGEILVTAHHADDQAETLLLRLLRGAGIGGVAAMRAVRPFSQGLLARPWLHVARAMIRDYANRHGLRWIDDPSNDAIVHDRNYLRASVMPMLEARWPHAGRSLARSAHLIAEAAAVVERVVAQELALAQGPDAATLSVDAFRSLDGFMRGEVLRAWLASLELPSPPASIHGELDSLLDAREDAEPRLAWPGAELRRYRDLVHAMAPLAPMMPWSSAWDGVAPLELPAGLGTLEVVANDGGTPTTPTESSFPRKRESIEAFAAHAKMDSRCRGNDGVRGDPAPVGVAPASTVATAQCPDQLRLGLRVTFRTGGERMALAASRPTRVVRDLLQELGIPPWQRNRLPFVFDESGLVALADVLVAERFPGRIRWNRPERR